MFAKKIETIPFRDFLVGTTDEQALPHKQYMPSVYSFVPISTDLLWNVPPEASIGYALVLGTGAVCFASMIFENHALKNDMEIIADLINSTINLILPTATFGFFIYCLFQLMNMTWW